MQRSTALSALHISVKKQSVGHRTSSPSTSKHPNQPVPGASFASFLWVAHILSPQWSLFQLRNKRLYQTPRYTLAVCADLIFDKGREQRRGKVITCAKWVWILAPHIQQPVLLNAPSKSVIQREKNLAATTCGGLSPRQTLPPVCTPRQMTIGLKAWLAQRSPIQYLFSQFKALAAAHLVSAVQSNAPLIATLRLRSPQSHIL